MRGIPTQFIPLIYVIGSKGILHFYLLHLSRQITVISIIIAIRFPYILELKSHTLLRSSLRKGAISDLDEVELGGHCPVSNGFSAGVEGPV
jgi:hypothetical protein